MPEMEARHAELEKAVRLWKGVSLASMIVLALVLYAWTLPNGSKAVWAQQPRPAEIAPAAAPQIPPSGHYANYCHLTYLPEELILDFAVNTNTKDPPKGTIPGSNRIILNYYTAKRLRDGLATVVKKYEDTFGPLELDMEKRAKGAKVP